ncbi:MAG: C25 family cysteine peptidase [Bacteroidales bacterium]|nr:C25 family cysteine peptidase [Bacteroidales bacterium]
MRLGYSGTATTAVLLTLYTVIADGQALRSHRYHLGTGMQQGSVITEGNTLRISYSVPEIDALGFSDEHGRWFRIGIPGHIPVSVVGNPSLPVWSKLITIPEGSSYEVRITDVKSSRIRPSARRISGDLYPVQESETKDQQADRPPFRINKEIYSSRRLIPSDTVTIEPLGTARGKRIAALTVRPVRYDPRSKSLEVITSMEISIIFSGPSLRKTSLSESILFADDLGKNALNFEEGDLITGYSDKPVRMIILTDTSFRKHLKPYIEWKTQKGFRIEMLYRGADFAGENYTDIKNSIASVYNSSTEENPPPEYLLIVGNVARIPYYGTGNITDLYYGEFDGGGDYFPEMYIGRLPVADTSDLKVVISKLIQYEKYQFADTNKFSSNALATAGIDDSHYTHMNGQVNYAVNNYLTAANNIKGFNFLYPNAKKDTIIKLINKGLSFINYTGHGSATGWLFLNITTSDVPALMNNNMYPFVISNACQTSRFSTSSFGNAMVLAPGKGAAGYIGCSADSYWDEDFYWAVGTGPVTVNPGYETTGLGALDRLFHTHGESPSEWYISMGQVIYAGNLAVSGSTTTKKKYYWEIYNLVGDPSIIPVIGTPGTFNIDLPDTLPNNLRSLSLIAEPHSYIAVSHFDTLWDASYVSPSGSVTLDLPGLSEDSCLVVVTGQNKKPIIKTIYFSALSGPFLNLSGKAVGDSLGNGNGLADYNETIFLRLTVGNLGSEAASGVTATITSTSPHVTINDGTADLGTILPGSEKKVYNDLRFTLSGNITDKSAATFDLKLKYGTTEKIFRIDVSIHAPELEIDHYRLDDTGTGNSNFLADPGENIRLVFTVMNSGSSSTSGEFTLSSPDPEISIPIPTKNSGIIDAGSIAEIPVDIKVSSLAAEGTTINLTAQLDCDPYLKDKSFRFRVGRFQETFESSSFRVFPWINVSTVPWTITNGSSWEGIVSAVSGDIGDNTSTTLAIKASYQVQDSIRFYYKVSSESGYDYFLVRINGTEVLKKSGEIPWTRAAAGVSEGINTIEWVYKKDGSVSGGSDCAWIDLVDFAGIVPVRYITRDVMAVRIASPLQSPTMGIEPVTVKLLSLGPDTIKGFNLAYILNDNPPVIQHFNDSLIYSGDTVAVTFIAKADLTAYGDYDLTVYSFNNNDDNLLNDTLRTSLKNKIRRFYEELRVNENNRIMASPNPFSDKLYATIYSEKEVTVSISLVSTLGKIIIDRKEYVISPGENPITIDGKMLEPGVYYLVVEFPGYSRDIKVVKLNNK